MSTNTPKVVLIITVKQEYLPKTNQNYARIEVVWKYNELEKIKTIVPGELSEITDDEDEEKAEVIQKMEIEPEKKEEISEKKIDVEEPEDYG